MWMALLAIAILVGWWLWAARKRDQLTRLSFDVWRGWFDSAHSPLSRGQLAASFLAQSLHFAVQSGVVHGRNKRAIAEALKVGGATNTVQMLLGRPLHAVSRVVDAAEINRGEARFVGSLLILAWLTPEGRGEQAVREFLLRS